MTPETQRALVGALREMTLLFRLSLLNTTPEITKDGMEFVNKANALIARAEKEGTP